MSQKTPDRAPGGVTLAEEAVTLIRQTPISVISLYYLATLPFAAGVLLFWQYMSREPGAATLLPIAAFALAAAFAWMKTLQTRYCQHLLALVHHQEVAPWKANDFWRTLTAQTWMHALGLLMMPVAALLMLPFGWCHAFLQHVTVLDDGQRDQGTLWRDALRMSQLWPGQNHLVIWLLSPFFILAAAVLMLVLFPIAGELLPIVSMTLLIFYAALFFIAFIPLCPVGGVIFINVFGGAMLASQLLGSVLGYETFLARVPNAAGMQIVIGFVVGIVWLLLDPVLKAAYVLRTFYAESQQTAADLRIALKHGRASSFLGSIAIFLLVLQASAFAQSPRPAPETLDAALDAELEQSRYDWRYPETSELLDRDSWLFTSLIELGKLMRDLADTMGEWFEAVMDWLFPDSGGGSAGTANLAAWEPWVRQGLIVLLVVLAVLLVTLLLRTRRRPDLAQPAVESVELAPDLQNEETTADQLPEDGWLALAQEMLSKGELRLAMRALFLAHLARLAHREFIRIARYKSNRDYREELRARAHAQPQLQTIFDASVRGFERVWYGNRTATPEDVESMRRQQETLRQYAP